jgi:hypothetical protein
LDSKGDTSALPAPSDQVKRLFEITHTKAILAIDPDLVTSVKKLQDADATPASVTS